METVLFLLVDGLVNGAIYAQVALSLVLIYTVTRVVNIAQGEYVMFGALTLASFMERQIPATLYLAVFGLALWGGVEAWQRRRRPARAALVFAIFVLFAVALAGMTFYALRADSGLLISMLASVVLVAALGPAVYQFTVRPIAAGSTIVFVIVSVGIQMTMQGLGLLFWGAGSYPVAPITQGDFLLGPAIVSYQSLWIAGISIVMMASLYAFFEFTILGKALRAAAVNRRGAQICGIPVTLAGGLSFALAAAFSAVSGMLVAPMITANYEMGFNIGLKGFVGSALGGLVDYPLAIGGVLVVGALESYSAYSLSAYRDAIVFMLIIPILIWRNSRHEMAGYEEL